MAEDEPRKMFKAVCSDCGKDCEVPFEPTEGKPIRCPDCFKKSRNSRGGSNRFGGNRFGSNNRFSRDRSGRNNFNNKPREMFKAKCASCGIDCEVPFKPTGDKPVYCRDCYTNQRN